MGEKRLPNQRSWLGCARDEEAASADRSGVFSTGREAEGRGEEARWRGEESAAHAACRFQGESAAARDVAARRARAARAFGVEGGRGRDACGGRARGLSD